MNKLILVILMLVLILGCTNARIKGGKSSYINSSGSKIELVQGMDAKMPSGYKMEYNTIKEMVIPAGSKIMDTNTSTEIIVSTNTPVKISTTETMDTRLGAAQKNVLGETIAKLSSMRPVQFVGIFLLLFGIASMVYPPLRLIVGSTTTSAVIIITGIGLIAFPVLLVGNEVMILVIGLGVVIGYFFVHRYGKKSGEVAILKKWFDDNKDGKVDEGEVR